MEQSQTQKDSQKNLFDYQSESLKPQIKYLLEMFPEYRDDDYKLASEIWRRELGDNIKGMTAREFILKFAKTQEKQDIANFKSIVRYRAMIQQEHPSLKGTRGDKRREDAALIAEKVIHNKL